MTDITSLMRQKAQELLSKGEVDYVIGWEKGTFWFDSTPVFIRKPEEAEKLIWDEFCLNNLAHYLLEDRYSKSRVALFVKGCDSRGIIRLLQDKQVERERLVLLGIPCPGLKDPKKAINYTEEQKNEVPLATRCKECRYRDPLIYDELLGDATGNKDVLNREEVYADISKREAQTPDEKYKFWEAAFNKCIRCFACRNICPACNCTVCCFDLPRVGWLTKRVASATNANYLLTRAFHVAGRCVECGECEQACPMGLPLMELNKKLANDIYELFDYEAGLDLETPLPLGSWRPDDPEEFE